VIGRPVSKAVRLKARPWYAAKKSRASASGSAMYCPGVDGWVARSLGPELAPDVTTFAAVLTDASHFTAGEIPASLV